MVSNEVTGAADISKRAFLKQDFAATRLPNLEASTLPPYCYTSPEFYKLEVEKLFLKEWLCVGRTDQVKKSGDFFSLDLLGQPLLITRDESNNIRALSRVCTHRGMLLAEGSGNRRTFECPYHLWSFTLRGELIGAPEMNKSKNFDKKQCALPSLQVETWEGFIFVNFDPSAKPLNPRLTGLSELLMHYKLSEMQSTESLVYDCDWNWKMMAENFMENYHVQGLHRDTVNSVLPARNDITEDLDGQYAVVHLPADTQVDVSISGDQGFSEKPPFSIIKDLTLDERKKIMLLLVYPCHLFFVMSDSMIYYQLAPEAVDRFNLRITLCVPPYTMEAADFEQNLKNVRDGIVAFHAEDMFACRGAQRGFASRFAKQGRLCYLEKVIWQISRYVMRSVLDGDSKV